MSNESQNSKVKQLFSNVFQIHSAETPAAPASTVSKPKRSSAVIKAGDMNQDRQLHQSQMKINAYVASEFFGAKDTHFVKASPVIKAPVSAEVNASPEAALKSLKQNLKTLNDLQSRMKFMLQEIEEFVIKS